MQFEKSKYLLVHFTRNKKDYTGTALTIDGTTVTPAKEARYLGVILDQKLRYHAHTNLAVKKGTQFELAIAGIARARWGTPFRYLRRLYTSVATPRMDYAVAIWHRSKDKTASTIQQACKFSGVQRHIMKAMTECF
jgi:hypothetical protein